MGSYVFDNDDTEEISEEELSDAEEISEEEEGFMKGYSDEDEALECAECGSAVRPEKKVVREINGEEFTFCSKDCADEFEEGIKEE